MGGRGSSSGVSDKGLRYGTEYTAVAILGNIKIITQNAKGSIKVPDETMSADKNRVYALLDQSGNLKSIIDYDSFGMRHGQIHPHGHGHSKLGAHYHGVGHATEKPLTLAQKRLLNRVKRVIRSL